MQDINQLPSANRTWLQKLIARGFAQPADMSQNIVLLREDEDRPASSGRQKIAVFLPTMISRFAAEEAQEFLNVLSREILFAVQEQAVDLHLFIAMQHHGESDTNGRAALEAILETLSKAFVGYGERIGVIALLLLGPGKVVSINAMTALALNRKIEAVLLIDDDVDFSEKCFSHLIRVYLASSSPVAIGARKIGQPFATSPSLILSKLKGFTQPAENYPHACCMIVSIEVIAPNIPLVYSSDDGYICFRLLRPNSAMPLERLQLIDDAYCYHWVGGRNVSEISSRLRRMLLHHHLFLSHIDPASARYYLSQLLFFGMWPWVSLDVTKGWRLGIIKCLLKYAYAIWFGKIGAELIVRGLGNRPLDQIKWGGLESTQSAA